MMPETLNTLTAPGKPSLEQVCKRCLKVSWIIFPKTVATL